MKIKPLLFGLAIFLSVAVLWSIYSVSVFSLMGATIKFSGDMAYLNFGSLEWTNFLSRFLINLVALSFGAGVTGWLIAGFYNCLDREPKLP